MNNQEIRQKFLDFFKQKGHCIVPSAPIVVKNDPTLMFTNAGMNQFKDYFLGTKEPSDQRVADTQKCLRVSGKHNDLEEVGIDTYHHTMFEMLGNWSFGDYFKKEAIEWAWELLTKVYQLDPDRLYVTVFGGDVKEGLDKDQESFDYWKEILPGNRILNGSKKDNFWEMGETGPCGPCSEIHIDLRETDGIKQIPGEELVNKDHPEVVELWNLVFIQYNRKANGSLESLPNQHVDTGMGFERLTMVIQGSSSTYDTDIFRPLLDKISVISNNTYGEDDNKDIAFRVIADHIRAVSFAIADGQLPSNTGAGYVIRRILRRGVRYGYSFLEFKEPFMHLLVEDLVKTLGEAFPELNEQQSTLETVIREEETTFLRTLETGLKKLDEIINNQQDKVISGSVAFELYDTYGFPIDLTSLIAREHQITVDIEQFNQEMEGQRSRSKSDADKDTGDWVIVNNNGSSEFIGYDHVASTSRITRYREIKEKGKSYYQFVLDKTPFYAESGGQVGDTGTLISGKQKIKVFDTQKENDLILHMAKEIPNDPALPVEVKVDGQRRLLTMNNHTATHLLHAALREVLGDHVQQKGSLVNEKLLRFDFSHYNKLTDEEIAKIETIVNAKIRKNIALEVREGIPLEEAKAMGAVALFGEKYADKVRVVIFDKDYSMELCGGTHVPATGNIGSFKIIHEGSIASGVRRIEAVTATEAEQYFRKNEEQLSEIRNLLKEPKDLVKSVRNLLAEKSRLSKELEKAQLISAKTLKAELLSKKEEQNGFSSIIHQVKLPNSEMLKKLAFELKNESENMLIILAAEIQDKPQIAVAISDNLVQARQMDASKIVKDLAVEINGGGGGQPFFATAGGKDLSGLKRIVEKAKELIR